MKGISKILKVAGVLLAVQLYAYGQSVQHAPNQDAGADKSVEIQVGTRTVTTHKFNKKGTPVVPMWSAPLATGDLRSGAGFPVLSQAEHAVVWQPAVREDGAYNHYACLIHYKGRFYAMWGNHPLAEDAPGQRVLYAHSDAWGKWTAPKELFPAPGPVASRSEKGIHLKPDRWAIVDDKLYAITYVHGAGTYPIARTVGEDGELGEPFLLRKLSSKATLPSYMKGIDGSTPPAMGGWLEQWYRDTNQISWWTGAAQGAAPRKGVDGASLIENFMYRAKDGGRVIMLRDWGTSRNPVHTNRLYVSFNNSTGKWGTPYPTDIPDSPSRAQAITLDDGTVLLIGNQNVPEYDQGLYLDRDPMTISVSKDGYTFDRVYALRTDSPLKYRFTGVRGRNRGYGYSSSVIHEGWLYTLYSIGKEEMGITRLPLSALNL